MSPPSEEIRRLVSKVVSGNDKSGEARQRVLSLLQAAYHEMLAADADSVSVTGGKGDSMDSAVVVRGAANRMIGIDAEYRYLGRRFGRRGQDWELVQQCLYEAENGRAYDILQIRLNDGTETEIYFDITEFNDGNSDAVL